MAGKSSKHIWHLNRPSYSLNNAPDYHARKEAITLRCRQKIEVTFVLDGYSESDILCFDYEN